MRISGVVVHWSLTIDGMVERRHVWTESAPVQNADSIVGHVLERLGPFPVFIYRRVAGVAVVIADDKAPSIRQALAELVRPPEHYAIAPMIRSTGGCDGSPKTSVASSIPSARIIRSFIAGLPNSGLAPRGSAPGCVRAAVHRQ
jgi:hypothetical protein